MPNVANKPLHPYSIGLEKNQANFSALSPLSFIEKAAAVYPDRIALIHGEHRISWAETYARCRRLAAAASLAPCWHAVSRRATPWL
jgi:fatty-acyl-CoA synthase